MSHSNDEHRVLYLTHTLGKNGITSHIRTLAEGVRAHGWKVAVAAAALVPDAPIDEAYLRASGIPFYAVPFPDLLRSESKVGRAVRSFGVIDDVVREFQPDVIHTHGMGTSVFTLKARFLQKIPVVSTCHNTPPPRTHALAKRLGVLNYLISPLIGNRVIAISYDMQDVLADLWKIAPDRLRLVHNGVDDEHFRLPSPSEREAARRALNLDLDGPVVCLIGRFYDTKGHDVLLKATRRLIDEGVTPTVLFAGTGPREQGMRQLAASLGLTEHVRFLGFTDARQVLWASDVFALPSRREGCPLVIAEAMLCGVVPVRTPAAGAVDQIDDGSNGFIVPFDDDAALAQRLRALFSDAALHQKMAATSRTMALEKFTARRMTQQTVAVYNELIHQAEPVHVA